MVTKLPRFKVAFGYICPSTDKIIYGKLDEQVFNFKDLDFFLKVISPTSSLSHIQYIRNLSKREVYRITFKELSEYGEMTKVLKIQRN